jgi:hypothetical protein
LNRIRGESSGEIRPAPLPSSSPWLWPSSLPASLVFESNPRGSRGGAKRTRGLWLSLLWAWLGLGSRPGRACAARRRRFSVGASPTRANQRVLPPLVALSSTRISGHGIAFLRHATSEIIEGQFASILARDGGTVVSYRAASVTLAEDEIAGFMYIVLKDRSRCRRGTRSS